MQILHVIPKIGAVCDGVEGYAVGLAEKLYESCGVQSVFLGCEGRNLRSSKIEPQRIFSLKQKSSKNLFEALSEVCKRFSVTRIILHYSGYGYAARGAPFWLLDGINKFRLSQPEISLITVFHETYATTFKPWSSSFWNQIFQKKIVCELALSSKAVICTNLFYKNKLEKAVSVKNIHVLPVFSNIGEPGFLPPANARGNDAVCFGASRKLFYGKYFKELMPGLAKNKISLLHDVGPGVFEAERTDKEYPPILRHGILQTHEISSLFRTVRYGLIICEPQVLEKSTVYASYCSHGIVPIIISKHEKPDEMPGFLYDEFMNLAGFREMPAESEKAFFWYQHRNLEKLAGQYNSILKND